MSNATSFHRELAREILSFPRDESQPSESHVLVIAEILAKRFPDLTNRYANYRELENVARLVIELLTEIPGDGVVESDFVLMKARKALAK